MSDIPKIVRERLQGPTTEAATHPDPNVLTAFAEQVLPRAERETVLEHLSRCADCREILALALPASEPTQIVVAKSSPSWFASPRIRWAFACAAIVLVSAIGFLEYEHHDQPVRMAKNADVPMTGQAYQQPATPPQAEKLADEQSSLSRTAKNSKPMMTLEKDSKVSAPAAEPAVRGSKSTNSSIAGNLSHGPRQLNQWQQQSHYAQQAPAPVFTMDAPAKQQAMGTAGAPSPNNEIAEIQTQAMQAELKPDTGGSVGANDRISTQPNADSEVSRAKSAPAPPAAIPSPIRAEAPLKAALSTPTWTITSGRLRRSFDQGATWQDVNINSSPDTGASLELTVARKVSKASQKRDSQGKLTPMVFRAVAVNGPDVWVGGTTAVLYHSPDAGEHWSRVVPRSSDATLTGDVLTLDFPNVQNGRISTSTGEVWTTSDSGQSWQKQ
jgi:hypothetical protein